MINIFYLSVTQFDKDLKVKILAAFLIPLASS